MKKLLILSVFIANSALAATTGTLNLIGIIPKKVEITVTSKPVASALDLETTASNLSVGTLTGKSNVNAGYKISVVSANAGKLVHSTVSTEFINYTLKIDAASVSLAGTGFLSFTGKAPFTKDVNISYTGVDAFTKEDGTYSDTLTFTISAN